MQEPCLGILMSASTWQPSRALNDSRPPYSTQPADCTATAKLILNPSTRVVPQKQVSAMLAPTGGILHQQTGGCHPHPTASPVSALQAYSDRQRQHAAYPPAAAQLQSQQIARQHYEWGFTALHAAGQTACMPAATQAAPSDLTHSARLPAHPLLQRLQTTVNSHNPSHIPGHVHCTPPNKWNPQQDAQHPLTMQYAVTPAAAGTETSSCSSGLPAARSSQGKRSNSKCKDAEVLKLVGQSLTKSGKASRRYRERQRGLVDALEAELAAKLEQFQFLSIENEMLKVRSMVLESAVASREDQMHITQEHGPPIYGPEHVLPPAANAEAGLAVPAAAGAVIGAHHSSCSGQQSTGYSLQPKETVQPDRALGSDAAEDSATQHLLLGGQSQDHWWSRAVSNMTDVSGIDSSPELVKNMSVDDIIGHWRGFVKAFTHELMRLQYEQATQAVVASAATGATAGVTAAKSNVYSSRPGLEAVAEARLREMTDQCTHLFKLAASLNPGAYSLLFGRNLDTGLPCTCADDHWRQVKAQLALTPEQVRHILAFAELYFSSIARLHTERAVLQQQIEQSAAMAAQQSSKLLMLGPDAAVVQPYLEQLESNLRHENVLRVMLYEFVWTTVFTPVQKANVAIHSHPLFPDLHAVCALMCKEVLSARVASGQMPRFVFPHRHSLQQTIAAQLRAGSGGPATVLA